jgi:hypothetical protein
MKKERLVDALEKSPKQIKKIAVAVSPRATKKSLKIISVPRQKAKTVAGDTTKKTKRVTALKRPVSKKKAIIAEPAKVELVNLPTNMSQRAVEKSVVFMREIERHFGDAAYRIAYVSGLCFILVGAAFSVSNLVSVSPLQGAQLLSVTDTTNTTTDTTQTSPTATTESTTDAAPVLYPETNFQFLTSVPHNVLEPTQFSFLATNVYPPVVKIVATDGSHNAILPIEAIASDKYRVVIPALNLAKNYYEFRINLKPKNGASPFIKRSNEFFVGTTEQEYTFNHRTEAVTESAQESDTEPVPTDGTTAPAVTETSSEVVPAKTTEATTTSPTEVTSSGITLNLTSPAGGVLSKGATLTLVAQGEPTFVELYARPVNAIDARFITLAAKRLNGWSFMFDSNNIPNGEYEFFAKAKTSAGSPVVSKSIRLTLQNVTTTSPVATATTTTSEMVRPPLLAVTDETNPESASPTTPPPVPLYSKSGELIQEHAEDLNTLFEHYAVARQTGDESLIKAAEEALDKRRETILLDSAQDDDMRDVTDRVSSDLAFKITDLKGRIDTFEELRKQRSSGATAVDSDGDGISDSDESQLYNTDPTAADTDNDGINDGVEIMRGYNPIDAKSEAIIRFESPKESVGLVRKDVLTVDEVLPLIPDTATESQPAVATEIKGRGLPNSFVTLYIFSSPTVVSVKTDADGVFVYTFDKELDDGQHDVYVAITDNAGEIIAHSEPFSFIKKAQAFTPIAAADTAIVSPPAVTESGIAGYNLAVGVGILALGLILLMLGIGLRYKRTTPDGLTEFIDSSESSPTPSSPAIAATDDIV